MKKLLFSVLLCLVVVLAGCTQYQIIPIVHNHSFATDWSYDAVAHWHETTCGHDITSDYAPHTLVETIDATGDTRYLVETCSVCGYENRTAIPAGEEYNVAMLSDGTTTTRYNTIKEAVNAWNSEVDGTYTLTIANGQYREYDITIEQKEGRNLTIQAETPHEVVLYDAGQAGEAPQIFYVKGNGGWSNTDTLTFSGIDFYIETAGLEDNILSTDNYSFAIRLASNVLSNGDWYAHNVTVENCRFYGDSDISYPVYSGNQSQPIHITITDSYAENVKSVYGGYGQDIQLRNSEFVNVMSILNNQMGPREGEVEYNNIISGITATVNYDQQKDDMYAIRSDGGDVLIENSTIRMENNTENYTGLVVIRDTAQTVKVINSTLEVYDHPDTIGKGYVFYSESPTVTGHRFNIDYHWAE